MMTLVAVICLSRLAGCNKQERAPNLPQPESNGIEMPDMPLEENHSHCKVRKVGCHETFVPAPAAIRPPVFKLTIKK